MPGGRAFARAMLRAARRQRRAVQKQERQNARRAQAEKKGGHDDA